MKKEYIKPNMQIRHLTINKMVCTSPELRSAQSNQYETTRVGEAKSFYEWSFDDEDE